MIGKSKIRWLALLFSAVMIMIINLLPLTISATNDVTETDTEPSSDSTIIGTDNGDGTWTGSYLSYNGESGELEQKTATATILKSDHSKLTSGWYVAIGEINSNVSSISGDVHIILTDGSHLYTNPIQMETNSNLCIYGQSTPIFDDYGDIDEDKSKAGIIKIAGNQEAFKGSNCTLTVNSGVIWAESREVYNTIEISSVTLNGGYLMVISTSSAICANVTINGGRLLAEGDPYGISGSVTINDFDRIEIMGGSKAKAVRDTIYILKELRVRIASVVDENPTYVPFENLFEAFEDEKRTSYYGLYEDATRLIFEHCTDETHDLTLKSKDADTHTESCEWCGYSQDVAHDFDEKTGICDCGAWHGSYLEYNSEKKKYETKTATATVITEDMTKLTSGWYVAIGNVDSDISSIVGEVHIILTDGSYLGTNSIQMETRSSLFIYGQSTPIFDEYGEIDEDKNKTGAIDIGGTQEPLKGSSCTLTVDGGVVQMYGFPAHNVIEINKVTLNGGYLAVLNAVDAVGIVANVTINGGRAFVIGDTYGIQGTLTINDFDYIQINNNGRAVTGTVKIAKELRVRIASVVDEEPTYIPFEDLEKNSTNYYKLNEDAAWLTFEPCTDETHDLTLKYKDADTHNESCKWCGLDRDVAHDFDEKTGKCDCGIWRGSYLEYNSKTKKHETKTATATVITEDMTKLTAGWYVVIDDYIYSPIKSISGDVHIILTDGSYLSTPNIQMEAGSNLRIYGQSTPIFDEYGDIDESKSKTGVLNIGSDQEALKGSYCTLTVDGGVVTINSPPNSDTIEISSVTLNGGYLGVMCGTSANAIEANVTINRGRLFAHGDTYGIVGTLTINDFDYIEIIGDSQAVTYTVDILEGLRVRIASVAYGDATYIPFENFADTYYYYYVFNEDATWLTIEHCTDETHEMNENKTLICKDGNVHTAICKWCGDSYDVVHEYDKDTGKCICGNDGISTRVIGYTLTLDGKIGVNFYMELSDEIAGSTSAYMHFILPDGSTCDVPVSDAKERIIDGKTYYVFSCYVAAYEMTSNIYAQIKEGDLSGTLYSFTIREYAEYIINNPSDYTEGDVAFAKALLNYGASAQTYFEVKADDLANKSLEDADKAITQLTAEDLASFAKEPISKEGIGTFVGFNLALGSETSLRAYFELCDGVNISDVVFTVSGVVVNAEKVGDYYRIAADNIKAFDLDEDITFTASVGDEVLTFECSALSYCHSVLSGDYPETLKTLISAIRAYQLASEIYK